jgi:hypothetical protein
LNGWWGGGAAASPAADACGSDGRKGQRLPAAQFPQPGFGARHRHRAVSREISSATAASRNARIPNKPITNRNSGRRFRRSISTATTKIPTVPLRSGRRSPLWGFPEQDRDEPLRGRVSVRRGNTFAGFHQQARTTRNATRPTKGDSVAKWEGDTLVVDTTNFNDQTWLGWPGYFTATSCTSSKAHANRQRDQIRGDRRGSEGAARSRGPGIPRMHSG